MKYVLTKHYRDKAVLKDKEIEIKEGEYNLLWGPSGIGKTTISRILMGLEKNEGEDVKLPGKLSVIFQEDRLIKSFSAYENIKLVSTMSDDVINEALEYVSIPKDQIVREFSGGMKRRTAILRAILVDADYYIFDEPFTGLDDKIVDRLILLIKKFTKNKSVIIISHNKRVIEDFDITNVIYL